MSPPARVASLAGVVALSACVVGTERPTTSREAAQRGQAWTGGDPGRPRGDCSPGGDEARPPAPSVTSVWIDAECTWDGVRHVRRAGRWEERAGVAP